MTAHTRLFIILSVSGTILTVVGLYLDYKFGPLVTWPELPETLIEHEITSPFERLAYLMAFLLLVSIIVMTWAQVLHRRRKQPLGKLWIAGLVTFAIVQMLYFTLAGAEYDLGIGSGTIDQEMALQHMHDWDFLSEFTHDLYFASIMALLVYQLLPNVTVTKKSKDWD